VRGTLNPVWPAEVEHVAAFLRAATAEARLEELAPAEDDFPGVGVRVFAFDCDGRRVVTLVPDGRSVDPAKLGCLNPRAIVPPAFPFDDADVRIDRTLFSERTVWIHAGSPRHVAGMAPGQLSRLLRASSVDVVAES
jgi:hypothetical protein